MHKFRYSRLNNFRRSQTIHDGLSQINILYLDFDLVAIIIETLNLDLRNFVWRRIIHISNFV